MWHIEVHFLPILEQLGTSIILNAMLPCSCNWLAHLQLIQFLLIEYWQLHARIFSSHWNRLDQLKLIEHIYKSTTFKDCIEHIQWFFVDRNVRPVYFGQTRFPVLFFNRFVLTGWKWKIGLTLDFGYPPQTCTSLYKKGIVFSASCFDINAACKPVFYFQSVFKPTFLPTGCKITPV